MNVWHRAHCKQIMVTGGKREQCHDKALKHIAQIYQMVQRAHYWHVVQRYVRDWR
jgi:hypothetical protein